MGEAETALVRLLAEAREASPQGDSVLFCRLVAADGTALPGVLLPVVVTYLRLVAAAGAQVVVVARLEADLAELVPAEAAEVAALVVSPLS